MNKEKSNGLDRRPIFNAPDALSGLRDSGIKSTASAIAEIVDNSIEAKAKNIQVLVFEEKQISGSRTLDKISEIAIYDDGEGMNEDILNLCLSVGGGNRRHRKGLGRFGYGLPNSSMSQCRRVEVYSWEKKDRINYTYLDYDEVIKEQLQYTVLPLAKDIPSKIKNAISTMNNSGTIILWKNCDRLDVSKGETLYKHMKDDLCRIFRHYLDDDDQYGKRINISFKIQGKDLNESFYPNDPLYLMTPNTCPGYEDKKTNVAQVLLKKIPVAYIDREGNQKQSEVLFSFSTALPETQKIGGGSLLGKHYLKNTGISLVRRAREIDFGNFGFFDGVEARERWWGCEIRFEPELDELFGLTNNKQYARKFNFEDDKINEDRYGKEEYEERKKTDTALHMRRNISHEFSNIHSPQIKLIKNRGAGGGTSRSGGKTSTDIANEVLRNNEAATRSFVEGAKKTIEEKKEDWKKLIKESDPEIKPEDLMRQIDEQIRSRKKIDISFGNWPGEQFFTIELAGDTAVAKINRDHPYYNDFYLKLADKGDANDIKTVDLLLMAYARMEDEEYSMREELQRIRSKWGTHLLNFLEALKKSS